MCFGNTPQAQMEFGIASNIAGGIFGYNQAQAQGAAEANYYNYLANQALMETKSAVESGQQQAITFGRQAQQFRQSQIASFAGHGVDPQSFSAINVVADTAKRQALDEQMIMYNANLRAVSALNQSSIYRSAAANAQSAAKVKAMTSLLGGAFQAANLWNMWRQTSRGQTAPPYPSYTAGGISGIPGQWP